MISCLNSSHCIYSNRCLPGNSNFVHNNIQNNVLIQPFIGIMIYDHPSLRLMYFSIVIILVFIGLISNILSLITFTRDRIRFTVCGVYLNIYAISGTILMLLFLINIILINFRYDDYLFHLWSCYGYPYVFSVIINIIILMSTAIVIENILFRYFIFDRFRSRKFALFTSFILINLVWIFNLEKIFTRYLLIDRLGHLTCIRLYYNSSIWFYINNFNSYICLIIPCMIHFICILFILMKIRQQNQIYHRKLFRYQDLLLPSSIILLCVCTYVILRYLLNTCITHSIKFYIRLHVGLIFILSIPSILTFVIYVIPNINYLKEFRRSWISRIFSCSLKKESSIKELESTYKLWQQRSSPDSIMTISSLNDGFIDIEFYSKIKLEV